MQNELYRQMTPEKFEAKKKLLVGFFLGHKYYESIKAMAFAEKKHAGFRKDNITPSFAHQALIAADAMNDHLLLPQPEVTFSAIWIHDTLEDTDVSKEEIESRFGQEVLKIATLLTKVYRGKKLSNEIYYENILSDIVAALIKGKDRKQNIRSMANVFSLEKQKSYIDETEEYVIPMLKKARDQYPEFTPIISNDISHITDMIELYKYAHNSKLWVSK